MPENKPSVEIEVVISNTQGLHARPVMRFVDVASRFGSAVRVRKDDLDVDGKSPMEMMLLEAVQGTTLRVLAIGEDAEEAVRDLAELVKNKFGEE
ncbi:MAG: HPr family phosphocarrier protein [Phycisphaerae bacterium]